MRLTSFTLRTLLALPTALAVISGIVGCAPINFADFGAGTGTGADGTSASGGFGGAYNGFDGGVTSSAEAGTGGEAMVVPPTTYGYLCGGSMPGCSTDPTSSDCAPGGDPSMGGGSPDGSTRTCQLVAGDTQIDATCGMAGPGASGDVCTSATSCQPGLGCATVGDADLADLAVCEPFCCGDPEDCPTKTYCKPTSLVGTQLPIPVCTPATQCELLNDDAWCKPGQACAIVRDDGTTSCIDAGPSQADGACPCAAGYNCSAATGTCLKLCHIGSDECGTGICQGGTKPYPQGIGFCVPL